MRYLRRTTIARIVRSAPSKRRPLPRRPSRRLRLRILLRLNRLISITLRRSSRNTRRRLRLHRRSTSPHRNTSTHSSHRSTRRRSSNMPRRRSITNIRSNIRHAG